MTLNLSELKLSTKSLISFLLVIGSLLQIPQVSATVFAFIKLHPHYASAFAVLTGIIALLHNPLVEQALGIKQTVDIKTETVSLTPPTTQVPKES
jgi:hypothetical protein